MAGAIDEDALITAAVAEAARMAEENPCSVSAPLGPAKSVTVCVCVYFSVCISPRLRSPFDLNYLVPSAKSVNTLAVTD